MGSGFILGGFTNRHKEEQGQLTQTSNIVRLSLSVVSGGWQVPEIQTIESALVITGVGPTPHSFQMHIDNVYPCDYNLVMVEIRKTETFAKWLDGLDDIRVRARIFVRIERLAVGNPGDFKPVGGRCFRIADRLWTRLTGLLQKTWQVCCNSTGWG